MVRLGALSDASIKARYPEQFPLDLGMQQAMFAPSLSVPKMNKSSKKVKHATDFARYPINDIKNFATIATPKNSIEAGFEGILNYRQKIGSENIPSDITSGYVNQKQDGFIMRVIEPNNPINKPITISNSMTTSATLGLGKLSQSQNINDFNRIFERESVYLQPQTKKLLMNLGDEATITRIVKQNFPPPLNGAKIKHNEALSILRKRYEDSPDDMEELLKAERSARVDDALPDRSNLKNLILDSFNRNEE
jgi:hypothetical protein